MNGQQAKGVWLLCGGGIGLHQRKAYLALNAASVMIPFAVEVTQHSIRKYVHIHSHRARVSRVTLNTKTCLCHLKHASCSKFAQSDQEQLTLGPN